eukprot:scaffold106577_cov30-Tisochrysis_lutea.AAC.2
MPSGIAVAAALVEPRQGESRGSAWVAHIDDISSKAPHATEHARWPVGDAVAHRLWVPIH